MKENIRASPVTTLHDQPRVSHRINDNFCSSVYTVTDREQRDCNTKPDYKCILSCCNLTHSVIGQLQKKGINPDIILQKSLKYVKDVSCVDQLSFVHNVTNVKVVAPDLPVGVRLHQFCKTWEALGAGPSVIRVLGDGYILPSRTDQIWQGYPTIISGTLQVPSGTAT